MIVSLPSAGWHKHIVRIDPGATSGWDWHGPEGSKPFLNASADLPVGAVIVSFSLKSTAFKGKAAAFVVVDGPALYRAAIAPADELWSTSLAPYVRPLLQMSNDARTFWTVQQILQRADTEAGPPLGCEGAAAKSRFKSELANLRRLYAGRLAGTDCTPDYVEASFRLWMLQQSGTCDLTPQELYDVLRDRCDLHSLTQGIAPARSERGFRLTLSSD